MLVLTIFKPVVYQGLKFFDCRNRKSLINMPLQRNEPDSNKIHTLLIQSTNYH